MRGLRVCFIFRSQVVSVFLLNCHASVALPVDGTSCAGFSDGTNTFKVNTNGLIRAWSEVTDRWEIENAIIEPVFVNL